MRSRRARSAMSSGGTPPAAPLAPLNLDASSLSRSPVSETSAMARVILPDGLGSRHPSSRSMIAIVVGMTVRHRRVMQVAAGGGVTWRSDDVSTEEPLEIRIGDVSLSVTMRTPGDDFDLVAGFLITEGIIHE